MTDRFWSKVQRGDACWIWTASLDGNGYGRFRTANVEYKAHVWIWQQHNGPKPAGMELDHTCGTRACVRLDHLELVTHRENLLRSTGLAARADGPAERPPPRDQRRSRSRSRPEPPHPRTGVLDA